MTDASRIAKWIETSCQHAWRSAAILLKVSLVYSLIVALASFPASAAGNPSTLRRLVERQNAHSTQKRRRTRARGVKRTTQRPSKTLPEGIWGGSHVGLNVTAVRVEVEFDCAHGIINQSIELDNEGRFDAIGTMVQEGGPSSVPVHRKIIEGKWARYRGRVEGSKLWLRVTNPETGVDQNVMTLTHGKRAILEKCY